MSQDLETELEKIEKKLNKATSERDVWASSKGGNSNFKMADQLVKSIQKERDSLIKKIKNQVK